MIGGDGKGPQKADPSPALERIQRSFSNGIPDWSLLLLGISFTPLLAAFFINLWKQPEYQFFPQALAAAAFLGWDRLREISRSMQGGKTLPAVVCLLLSLVLIMTGQKLSQALCIWESGRSTAPIRPPTRIPS